MPNSRQAMSTSGRAPPSRTPCSLQMNPGKPHRCVVTDCSSLPCSRLTASTRSSALLNEADIANAPVAGPTASRTRGPRATAGRHPGPAELEDARFEGFPRDGHHGCQTAAGSNVPATTCGTQSPRLRPGVRSGVDAFAPRRCRRQHAQSGGQRRAAGQRRAGNAQHQPLAPASPGPAAAALLKISCPIRFSSTSATASTIVAPPQSWLVVGAGSSPMYWSPSRPEVRILAELSWGTGSWRGSPWRPRPGRSSGPA